VYSIYLIKPDSSDIGMDSRFQKGRIFNSAGLTLLHLLLKLP